MDPFCGILADIPTEGAHMPEHDRLEPDAPWTRLVTTEADWDAADPGLLTSMLSSMGIIRAFEEFVLQLASEGLIHGPAHSSIGQEGGAVGSTLPLTSADTVNPTVTGSTRAENPAIAPDSTRRSSRPRIS